MSRLKLVPPVEGGTPPQGPASGIRKITDLLVPCETCRTKDAAAPFCDECAARRRVAAFMAPVPAEPEASPPELCEDCKRRSLFVPLCAACEAAFRHAEVLDFVRHHPA